MFSQLLYGIRLTLEGQTATIIVLAALGALLSDQLATGKSATGDFERLSDLAINAMLARLAAASTVAQQTAALAPIAKFVAANLPIRSGPGAGSRLWQFTAGRRASAGRSGLAPPGRPVRWVCPAAAA